jgi:hypothetical protein
MPKKKTPWEPPEPPPIHLPYVGPTRDAPKPQRCLKCDQFQDAATGFSTQGTPKPEDCAICFRCGHIMIYQDDLSFRNATPKEFREISSQPDVKILRDYIASRNRKSPWS